MIATQFGFGYDAEGRPTGAVDSRPEHIRLTTEASLTRLRVETSTCSTTTALTPVPIPGTTKIHRLEENVGAVGVALTPDDLRDIDAAASAITVHGHRYSEGSQRLIDR